MDTAIKNYIDSLDRRSIPWNRMFTAYGTAEHYNELLSVLEEITDEVQWKKTFTRISRILNTRARCSRRLRLYWYFLSGFCKSTFKTDPRMELPKY